MADMTWRDALSQGNLSEAKKRYLESDEQFVLESHFWLDLQSLQKHLRAKHWQRAYNIIEVLELPEMGSEELVDREGILAEIKVLKESSILLDRRRADEALASLESVVQPLLQAEKKCQQGTASIFQNDIEQAKTLFAESLELDSLHYRSLTNLGNIHLESTDVDSAIVYYEKALAIKDDFGNALHNLGVAYRQKGQIAKSVKLIKKAQANVRKTEEGDARGELSSGISKSLGGMFSGKMMRYGFYGLAIVIVLYILRSRGMF